MFSVRVTYPGTGAIHTSSHTPKQIPCTRVSRLTDTDVSYILYHMKTTLNIDDEILAKAARLTGVKEKTTLVRMGLEALVARSSAQRLAALGGSEPSVKPITRRRTA